MARHRTGGIESKRQATKYEAGAFDDGDRVLRSGLCSPSIRAGNDIGLTVSVGEQTRAFAGCSGRCGSESRQDHRLSPGLRVSFRPAFPKDAPFAVGRGLLSPDS